MLQKAQKLKIYPVPNFSNMAKNNIRTMPPMLPLVLSYDTDFNHMVTIAFYI